MQVAAMLRPALHVALAACCLLVAGAGSVLAATPRYEIRSLGTVPGGGGILAWDINEHGDVTGIVRTYGRTDRGFLYRDGRMRALPFPAGALSGIALGLNDLGDAVGQVGFPGGVAPPVLYRHDGSVLNLLDGLQGDWFSGRAADINDAGVATGYAYGRTNDITTFLHDGTRGWTLNIPGVARHEGLAINAAGEVLIGDLDSTDAYLYSQGRVTRMPQLTAAPGSTSVYSALNDVGDFTGRRLVGCCDVRSFILHGDGRVEDIPGEALWAVDINNRGWVVGNWYDHGGFLYRDGQAHAILDLLSPDAARQWSSVVIAGINDAGQIAGYGTLNGSYLRSFVATPLPVPEASTTALMLAGLGVLGGVVRARRPRSGSGAGVPTRCAGR